MYIIEGNIGVGKSTLLDLIKQEMPQVKILKEPVDNWINKVSGQSLLENFYTNPKRWTFTLEILAMITRAKDHMKAQVKGQENKNNITIIERSIYSGHYCFALNGQKNGFFTSIEWEIYNEWINFLLTSKCIPPKGFIYLKANPEICFNRIQQRGRSSEKSITIDYIKQIDFWHEQFLIKKEAILEKIKNVPVLVLNCNQNFIENAKLKKEHLSALNSFFYNNDNEKL